MLLAFDVCAEHTAMSPETLKAPSASMRRRRTCRKLADLVEQLELPGGGHLPDLGAQLLRGRLDVELEAETVAVALSALDVCSEPWTLVRASTILEQENNADELRGAATYPGAVCSLLGRASVQAPRLHTHSGVWYSRAYHPTDR